MFGKLRRALQGAGVAAPETRTFYHWRCECGAHSRGGDPFKSDAEYNAQRHVWSKAKGHPTPEIYSTEEEVPTY